jgi:hypothetical protein
MTYARRPHPPQPADLRGLDEGERFIDGGALWCRRTLQSQLQELRVVVSESAKLDMVNLLSWRIDNVKAFISQLAAAHYLNSQWCYTTKGSIAYAADAYCMGFNRHTGVENQRTDPWVYFKFSVIEKTGSILVLSAHPERK